MKKCSKCLETKELTQFYKQKAGKYGVGSKCKPCLNEYSKEWSKRNRPKRRLAEIKYALKNPELMRKKDLKKNYNITTADYNKMAEEQNNLCKICNKPETQRLYLCVDHNHTTNEIRGLLCNNCNKALGLFKDNVEIIENASKYLKSNPIIKTG